MSGRRRWLVAAVAPADVVVIEGDPAQDIRALGKVRDTLRAGRVIVSARG